MPLIDTAQFQYSAAGAVRVRATATDPFASLRGHAYIAARQLNAPVLRLERHSEGALVAILNIQAGARQQRRLALITTAPVWDMNDDDSLAHLHQLFDLEDAEA